MFFFMLPLSFFEKIASWSDQYAYTDWVAEKHGADQDGNKKKVTHSEEAPPVLSGRSATGEAPPSPC